VSCQFTPASSTEITTVPSVWVPITILLSISGSRPYFMNLGMIDRSVQSHTCGEHSFCVSLASVSFKCCFVVSFLINWKKFIVFERAIRNSDLLIHKFTNKFVKRFKTSSELKLSRRIDPFGSTIFYI